MHPSEKLSVKNISPHALSLWLPLMQLASNRIIGDSAGSGDVAKALNAEILLLHIVEDVPIPPSLVLGNERIWIAQTRRTVSRKLAEGWMKMAEEKIIKGLANENIKVTSKVLIGNTSSSTSDQILKFAKDNQINMIIMGSKRLVKGVSKIKALGSVSRSVSERASCPVLIVH